MKKQSSLWPREHGAYMELAFPIVSAWIAGAPTVAALALGFGAFAAFLAHEPLLVAVGGRGARRRREDGPRAHARVLWLGVVAAALGGVGLGLAPPLARALSIVPAIGAAIVLWLAARGNERNLGGEITVAVALASVALPVAVAAELSLTDSLAIVAVWAIGQTIGTTAARGVIIRGRDGGRCLLIAAIAAVVATTSAAGLGVAGAVSPVLALAFAPLAAFAVGVALKPPSPKRMHAVGFGLVGGCALTLVLLVTALA